MTKKRKFLRSLLAALLVILLAGTELVPALAVTQAQIDRRKQDITALRNQKKDIQAQLDKLAGDKSKALQQKALLDEQIAATTDEIAHQEELIAQYDQLIAQQEAELQEAEEKEAAQYELFCQRVRAMEEQGDVSYWAVLFKANSFTDLISRVDFIHEIMDADQRVIDTLQALQAEIEAAKTQVEASRAESQAAKTELETQKSELDRQRTQANQLIREIDDNEADYQDALDAISQDEESIAKEIERLNRELVAQQSAQGKSTQSNPGGYIWPVDSRYITSTVGGRTSPGGIGSTNHKGTDIGRVGYTSPVYAAKAGTVIVSQSSSSYGNYVVISHGSGNTTLYAHMSQRKVSVGQTVAQGDVIGITGSTGHSTGPHLHFEVVEGGVRVNPLNDGADPKKGYLTGYTLSSTA